MVKLAEQDLHFSSAGEVGEDLTAAADGGLANENRSDFDPVSDKHMWLDRDQDSLLDVNEASIFYDDFPALPDFPCMSSSSTQPASKAIAVTSSSSSATSAASWAVMRSDAEEDSSARMSFQQLQDEVKIDAAALSSTASDAARLDCVDVMETFGYMDLIDCNELWDPSSVFQSENPRELLEDQQAPMVCEEEKDGLSFLQGNSELAMIFFEWLKQNKDYISAEDMRSIKLKRSTIESASKRLGSTKEGKKQLLKLILDWVEQYQLQKKARQSPFPFEETADPINHNSNFMYPNTAQWMVAPPSFAPGEPYPINHGVVNGIPYQHSAVMEHAPSWAMSQFSPFPDNGGIAINWQQSLYANPYQTYDPNGERIMRLGSSATKEARKKRMARQRRLYLHPQRHSRDHLINDPYVVVDDGDQGGSPGDWVYWSPGGGRAPQPSSADPATVQRQSSQRQSAAASDRRQQQVAFCIGCLTSFLMREVELRYLVLH